MYPCLESNRTWKHGAWELRMEIVLSLQQTQSKSLGTHSGSLHCTSLSRVQYHNGQDASHDKASNTRQDDRTFHGTTKQAAEAQSTMGLAATAKHNFWQLGLVMVVLSRAGFCRLAKAVGRMLKKERLTNTTSQSWALLRSSMGRETEGLRGGGVG